MKAGVRRAPARAGFLVALVMALVGSLAIVGEPSAYAQPTMTTFPVPSHYFPGAITTGSDGALWFGSTDGYIGRMTTSGTVTKFPTGDETDVVYDLAPGPDNAIWFTSGSSGYVARITTAGVVTKYTVPDGYRPISIARGPDGAMWFTNTDAGPGPHPIGRITMSGAITIFPPQNGIYSPRSIVAGSDGAMWFTTDGGLGEWIARITTSGTITVYAHSWSTTAGRHPGPMTLGPDGAVWFVINGFSPLIGRITPSGTVSTFSDPRFTGAHAMAAGPDGALWFVHEGNMGRLTTSGAFSFHFSYSDFVCGVPPCVQDPQDIQSGPDGALWVTDFLDDGDFENGVIHRIVPSAVPAGFAIATASLGSAPVGQAYNLALSATGGTNPIKWKKIGKLPKGIKLHTKTGVLSGTPVQAGTSSFSIQVKDSSRPRKVATKAFSLTVTAPPLVITTANVPNGTVGQPYSKALIATGGSPQYKWKKIGTLPKGVKLNAKTGVLAGTPTKAGTTTFSVQVTDKSAPKRSATKAFTITVN